MISSVFKYAYPHAKIRALKGNLLSQELMRALLQTETFEEVLHVLRMTPYADGFGDFTPDAISIPLLTRILHRNLFEDYEKTIRSVARDIQPLFILLYQKYELVNLKTILRGIISHTDPQDIAALLLPTERYTLFSKDTLLEYHEVHHLIEALQGSFFQYPLNQALRRFEEEQEFFPLEMALDLHYYHTLWDATLELPEQERQESQHILGMWLDILNVAWVIRFKEHYHFSPEEILNYLIQHGYAFKLRERRQLAYARGSQEVREYLKTTGYARALEQEDEAFNTLHVTLFRYLGEQLYKYFFGNPFHIGVLLGYLLMKEFEISDILTIAEAKKYGFSLEQSQHYVIRGGSD
ncbi:MAG: V-type ATPase subunit [Candidatus Vecturithrix sp.]|jgi:V/A-type H+-transporting ATPase subunit C|nr:V-type ATPase subunit [Candidatus Vecturithrix sp.]